MNRILPDGTFVFVLMFISHSQKIEDICYVEQVSLNNNTSSFNASCYSGPEDINVNVELLLDRTLENSKLRGKWKQAEVQSSNDIFTFRSK